MIGAAGYLCMDIFPDLGKAPVCFRSRSSAICKWHGERFYTLPHHVKVVGTTGAGDSAIAGLLCAVYHGFGAVDAVKFASKTAACSISAMDPLSGIPAYEQIIAKDDWK
jgi:sugar/nucleoside kinase (ribokinase family)